MGTGSCKFSELFYSEAIAKNVIVISSNVHTISLCIIFKKSSLNKKFTICQEYLFAEPKMTFHLKSWGFRLLLALIHCQKEQKSHF
jgi:hypothetical protein